MADIVEMIQLSPTMEEGRLVAWLKKEGDTIRTGDLLAEVETDKATMEMESYFDGTILKLVATVGDALPVGSIMAVIGEPGEDITALLAGGRASAAPAVAAEQAPAAAPTATEPAAPAPTPATGRILASPVAKKVAEEKGVPLQTVHGSGPAGRIIRRDVEAAAAAPAPAPATAAAPAPAPAPTAAAAAPAAAAPVAAPRPGVAPTPLPAGERGELVALSPMRKAIARNLSVAWQAPSFTLTRAVDMAATMSTRKQLNQQLADSGSETRVSVNDFVIKACARALIDIPEMNSEYREEGLFLYRNADIGVAVAIEGGLITPVVRSAQSKGVAAIAAEVRTLAKKARDKKLQPDEFTGSTFSISNLGMFGIDHFTAVLNPPAAGILAVGQVASVPVVDASGQLVVGERMNVTLTADHRAIDGARGAEFLAKVVFYLEHPLLMMA